MTTMPEYYMNYLDTVRHLARSIFEENLGIAIVSEDEKQLEELIAFLLKMKNDVRWYSFTLSDLKRQWDQIYEAQPILDFVVNCTNEFYVNLHMTPEFPIEEFTKRLCESITVTRPPVSGKTKETIADPEYRDRGLTTEEWQQVMDRDKWVQFLYLIKVCGIDAGVVLSDLTAGKPVRMARRDQDAG